MDRTELENMLGCFYAKVNKRIADYIQYTDVEIQKNVTDKLGYVDSALTEILEMQTSILGGDS